jgi:hypothetical protein
MYGQRKFFVLSLAYFNVRPERETNDAVASRSCLLPYSLIDKRVVVTGQVLSFSPSFSIEDISGVSCSEV